MDGDQVEVHFFAAARAAVGAATVHVDPGTLGTILDDLDATYSDFGSVRLRCSFLVDGVAARDMTTSVAAGGRVDVLPPFAGG